MKVRIVGKNIEITRALKDVIEKKMSRMDKFFMENVSATATLSVQKNVQKIEVIIPFNGVTLRAEEKNEDMYAAIDLVIDKLLGQVRKEKTKLQKRNYEDCLKFQNIMDLEVEDGEEDPKIVKIKRFHMKPMSDEEAILQMELLGHDFFVYTSAVTEGVNVVYKRKDGNYGLIEQGY